MKPKALRALLYNTTAHFGGAEKSVYESVLNSDFKWYLHAPKGELSKKSTADHSLTPLLRLGKKPTTLLLFILLYPVVFLKLCLSCFRLSPSLLYANNVTSFLPLLPVSFLFATPVVLHLRDRQSKNRIIKWLILRADLIILPSTWLRTSMPFLSRDAAHVHVVENGIDIEPFEYRMFNPPQKVRVIMVSQFVPWKGCHHFIEMARILIESGGCYQFELVGGDPLGENKNYVTTLVKAAQEDTLRGSFTICSWQENIEEVYARADILVLPSLNEPFGRVIVEAGAAGLAVIALDGSGPAEILDFGLGGILVEKQSPEAFAKAVTYAVDNAEETQRRAEHLVTKIKSTYTSQRCASAITAACGDMLQRQKRALNTALLSGLFSGVEHSIHELVIALKKVTPCTTYSPPQPLFLKRVVRILWEHTVLPFKIRGANMLLAPGYIAPLFSKKPIVLIVHDCIARTHPHLARLSNRMYYALLFKYSLRKAHRIITPSNYVADEIVRVFKIEKEKIRVIPWGIRKVFRESALPLKKEKEAPYLIHVGNAEPKKNIETILKTLKVLPKTYRLLLVGAKGWGESLTTLLHSYDLKNRVSLQGYVTDEELASYYRNAHALIFPSLCEGFALPLLEAMSMGLPVIASDRGSIPEVSGGAALLCDAHDVGAFAKAVISLENTTVRNECIARGLKHARAFSWDVTAAAYVSVFNEIAGE